LAIIPPQEVNSGDAGDAARFGEEEPDTALLLLGVAPATADIFLPFFLDCTAVALDDWFGISWPLW